MGQFEDFILLQRHTKNQNHSILRFSIQNDLFSKTPTPSLFKLDDNLTLCKKSESLSEWFQGKTLSKRTESIS